MVESLILITLLASPIVRARNTRNLWSTCPSRSGLSCPRAPGTAMRDLLCTQALLPLWQFLERHPVCHWEVGTRDLLLDDHRSPCRLESVHRYVYIINILNEPYQHLAFKVYDNYLLHEEDVLANEIKLTCFNRN